MSSDLLGVLMRDSSPAPVRDELGAVVLATVAKGLLTGARRGFQWVKSPEGRKHLDKLRVTADSEKKRIALYETKIANTKSPSTKARWEKRLARARKRYAELRLDERLAAQGIVDEGPVLEVKRNLLASQWEKADDARKTVLEKKIAAMDARMARLVTEQKLIAEQQGSQAREVPVPVLGSPARRLIIPSRGGRFEKGVYGIDTKLAQGVGGLVFRRFAPPGPGRLVQVPFYPRAADSWIGANGIEEPGDDPVLCARVVPLARTAGPYLLYTRELSWGRYRIVGVQTQDQPIVQCGTPDVPGVAPDTSFFGLCFSLAALRVHNDRNTFVQEDQIAAQEFTILPASYEYNSAKPIATSNNLDSAGRYTRGLQWNTKYAGLRDYPVIGSSSTVSIEVHAFAPIINIAASDIQVPFTVNLLVEVLEDEMLGDINGPSPAARAGAVVKLGGKEIEPGHYEVISAGYQSRGK